MRMVREAARDELRATPRGHPNKRLSSQRAAAVREVGKPAVLRDVEAQRAIREVNLSIAGVPRPPRVRARPAKQLARQAFLGARFSNHDVERDRGGNQFAAPTGRNQSMVQYDEAWENQRHSDGENSNNISAHVNAQRGIDKITQQIDRIAMMIEAGQAPREDKGAEYISILDKNTAHDRVRSMHQLNLEVLHVLARCFLYADVIYLLLQARHESERKVRDKDKQDRKMQRLRKQRRVDMSHRKKLVTKEASYQDAMERAKFDCQP